MEMQSGQEKVVETTDLAYATFLSWKQCKEAIPPWKEVIGWDRTPKMAFRFADVDPKLIDEFKKDKHGFQRYNGIRRLLLRVIKTEMERK